MPYIGWAVFNLSLGNNNTNVKRLETFLYDLWYNPGTIDYYFSSSTTEAVEAFQSDFGLVADGIVGPNTYNKLIEAHRFYLTPRILMNGKKGDDVAELQARLTSFGYSAVADGLFGPNAESAVKSFQGDNGLTVDGIVGNQTYIALTQ
jgi:peptidoglycan hydrolase-like protein with peptidoglycan-binding domain